MEAIYSFLAVAVGIALRLGIPILITILIIFYLHRLDKRWQAEGEEIEAPVEKPECWKVKGCPSEDRPKCVGYLSPLPCWQSRRLPNGYLREQCLTCTVFHRAAVPTLSHA